MKTFQINTVLKKSKMFVYISDIHFKMTYWHLGRVPRQRFGNIIWHPLALNDFIKTTYNHGGKVQLIDENQNCKLILLEPTR